VTGASFSAHVSRTQALTTIGVLALAALVTLAAFDLLLRRETDRQLRDLGIQMAKLIESQPGRSGDPDWILEEVREWRPPDVRLDVRTSQGVALADGPGPSLTAGEGCTTTVGWRRCVTTLESVTVGVARDEAPWRRRRQQLASALGALTLLASMLVLLLSGRVARRALRPLTDLGRAMLAIQPGMGRSLDKVPRYSELETLAVRFNELLARYEEALNRERRFAATASHELQTPVTLLCGELETLVATAPESARPQLERACSAAHQLSRLVTALLWFSKAETVLEPSGPVVNVADLLRERVSDLVSRRRVDLEAPEELLAHGDETLLGRGLGNLLENAEKYGGKGPIAVRASSGDGWIRLRIENEGLAIPEAMRSRIFEPFFRATAQNKDSVGFGLGLPFARAVARAHGGEVELAEAVPGRVAFVIRLPEARAGDSG